MFCVIWSIFLARCWEEDGLTGGKHEAKGRPRNDFSSPPSGTAVRMRHGGGNCTEGWTHESPFSLPHGAAERIASSRPGRFAGLSKGSIHRNSLLCYLKYIVCIVHIVLHKLVTLLLRITLIFLYCQNYLNTYQNKAVPKQCLGLGTCKCGICYCRTCPIKWST